MSESGIKTTKNKIHELASQIFVLATGLQNAAPPGGVGKSIHYLLETASQLELISREMEALITGLPIQDDEKHA
jgi:hypothetical protein